jgi:hypothetical protein
VDFFEKGTGANVQRLQVMRTGGDALQFIQHTFHSSVVCNVLTADETLFLYPLANLQQKLNHAFNSQPPDPRQIGCIRKYEERGWKYIGWSSKTDPGDKEYYKQRFYHCLTMCVKLGNDGEEKRERYQGSCSAARAQGCRLERQTLLC